eukprot:GHVQ01029805.1.p1 GENE.GHVQ01029805.1~~GHVQ01029805.1.p1  ORF type:complete len:835 (-),score=102.76 GHVQ01029805.1:2079-4583(-)
MTGKSFDRVGISVWLRQHEGIMGKFKQRYQDFQVYEVGYEGDVVHLTEILTKHKVGEERRQHSDREKGKNIILPNYSFPDPTRSNLRDAGFLETDICNLELFIRDLSKLQSEEVPELDKESVESGKAAYPVCVIYGGISDLNDQTKLKYARRRIHAVIREQLPFLVTEAITEPVDHLDKAGAETSRSCSGGIIRAFPKIGCLRDIVPRRMFNRIMNQPDCIPQTEKLGMQTNGEVDVGAVCVEDEACFHRRKRPRQAPKTVREKLSNDSRDRWEDSKRMFLRFHLYKENRDTSSAISMLASCLGRRPKDFSYAGIKDKRGVTVQAVTAFKVTESQLKCCMLHPKFDSSIRLSNFTYVENRLQLGNLQGNLFRVALREHSGSLCDVTEAVECLKTRGFVNYFGLQRFGATAIGTHVIGAALLKRDWRRAVRLILGSVEELDKRPAVSDQAQADQQATGVRTSNCRHNPLLGENCPPDTGSESPEASLKSRLVGDSVTSTVTCSEDDTQRMEGVRPMAKDFRGGNRGLCDEGCRIYLDYGNARDALKKVSSRLFREKIILTALAQGKSFLECLLQIPRSSLQLYIHAAQSVVFNLVASYRLQKFGTQPVVGDLVYANAIAGAALCDKAATKSGENSDCEDDEVVDVSLDVVELKTEEEAQGANIFDVVLPLPGDSVCFPKHLQQIYDDSCREALGVKLSEFMASNQGLGLINGCYRKMLCRPSGVRWNVVEEDSEDRTSPVIATDVDEMLGTTIVSKDPFRRAANNRESSDIQFKGDIEGDISKTQTKNELVVGHHQRVLLLECFLPKSSYLTMALRELLTKECSIECERSGGYVT